MAIKNRLRDIRHELYINTQKEMAEFLDVNYRQLSKWESQEQQPTTDTLVRLWLRLKIKLPQLNLQDLLELSEFK